MLGRPNRPAPRQKVQLVSCHADYLSKAGRRACLVLVSGDVAVTYVRFQTAGPFTPLTLNSFISAAQVRPASLKAVPASTLSCRRPERVGKVAGGVGNSLSMVVLGRTDRRIEASLAGESTFGNDVGGPSLAAEVGVDLVGFLKQVGDVLFGRLHDPREAAELVHELLAELPLLLVPPSLLQLIHLRRQRRAATAQLFGEQL